ncbi:Putative glycosyltransferase EpsH [Gimesia maris]|uniref:glycosyltransferase n=1 Tax=Gimesia maris TaxID=122 RepID=UPI00118CBEAD|nr:glycosyltransferase [Gimesia maris]QDU16210.1 Putative glycosyltransferase EpsH [Gimesia maris]
MNEHEPIPQIEKVSSDSPTSSIVVCVYNRARSVVDCLNSILELNERNWELVLVDDCSTDTTPAVLAQYQKDHPEVEIKIVSNLRNLGVSGARNAGINAASGRFIFFTDSDCTVDPNWLSEHLVSFSNSSISAVAGRVIDDPPHNWAEHAISGSSRIAEHHWQGRNLIGCNMGFRREVLKKYLFDEDLTYYCDEDDLALRMVKDKHQFAFAPEAIVYHHHPYTLGSYLRQAWRQGKGSAHFWWKHGIYLGRDVILVIVIIMLLIGALLWQPLIIAAMLAILVQLAALFFNEVCLKRKTILEGIMVLPLITVANQVKAIRVIITVTQRTYHHLL